MFSLRKRIINIPIGVFPYTVGCIDEYDIGFVNRWVKDFTRLPICFFRVPLALNLFGHNDFVGFVSARTEYHYFKH